MRTAFFLKHKNVYSKRSQICPKTRYVIIRKTHFSDKQFDQILKCILRQAQKNHLWAQKG